MNKIKQVRTVFFGMIPMFFLLVFSCTRPMSTYKEEVKIYLLNELDEAPEFEGGYEQFITFLLQEIQKSPKGTFDSIEEKVYVDFVIDENGTVTEVNISTPISIGAERALKSILENSPSWKPGKVNGKPVFSFQTLPIKF
jgi:protein TonB